MIQMIGILQESPSIQKIAILGLDNAGKTTIVKTVMKEFDELNEIVPTKGVERYKSNFLGKELAIWDYGGQDKYKTQYFENPEKFFEHISCLYYVLDCQNYEDLDLNIDFFLDCYQECMKYSPRARIFIFFHKYDLGYNEIDFAKIENEFLNETLTIVEELSNFVPIIFHTSIDYPTSIITSFIQPLLNPHSIHETIGDVIREICTANKFKFGAFLTENLFELGNFSDGSISDKKLYQFIRSQIEKLEHINTSGRVPIFKEEIAKFVVKKFYIFRGSSEIGFYLIIGMNFEISDTEIIQKDVELENFVQKLKKIIENSDIFLTDDFSYEETK